jgi:predicted RNA-binding Zn ribbon-like protein
MLRLNQAALDLLQIELRTSTRLTYAQVNFADALVLMDTTTIPDSTAEATEIAHELVAHRLQRLHDNHGQPASYAELRRLIIDLVPGFSDAVLRHAARLNGPPRQSQPWFHSIAAWRWPAWRWPLLATVSTIGGLGMATLSGSPQDLWQRFRTTPLATLQPAFLGETAAPRSNELIPTAETFAGIVRQQMSSSVLSVEEWQTVVNQWQEAIDLLAQVPPTDSDYFKAQQLIQTYRREQTQSQQRLQQERQSQTALKSATGRVNWLIQRSAQLKPAQKTEAIAALNVQLRPVTKATTGYAAAQQLRDRLAQKLK